MPGKRLSCTGMSRDPLLEALARLREIDGDYVDAHPGTADEDLFQRMLDVWLAATAVSEVELRGAVTERETVEAEMAALAEEGFAFDPNVLFELEQRYRDGGDYLNAGTIALARAWIAIRLPS
jgi:hypothetical protein